MIDNAHLRELTEALAARIPTPTEIREAMALAYNLGKTDGSLETAQRLLDKMEATRA